MKRDIFETMQEDIMGAGIDESTRRKMLKNVMRLKEQKINIMVTGATGCGKSSTINALFDTEVAKVGVDVNPETCRLINPVPHRRSLIIKELLELLIRLILLVIPVTPLHRHVRLIDCHQYPSLLLRSKVRNDDIVYKLVVCTHIPASAV